MRLLGLCHPVEDKKVNNVCILGRSIWELFRFDAEINPRTK